MTFLIVAGAMCAGLLVSYGFYRVIEADYQG
jgi:hypothetical protein